MLLFDRVNFFDKEQDIILSRGLALHTLFLSRFSIFIPSDYSFTFTCSSKSVFELFNIVFSSYECFESIKRYLFSSRGLQLRFLRLFIDLISFYVLSVFDIFNVDFL